MKTNKKFIEVGDKIYVEEFYYPEGFIENLKSLWQDKYLNIIPPIRLATKEEIVCLQRKKEVNKK